MSRELSVIVVDDQRDIAESTGALLRLYGHRTHVFNSGKAVLEALDHVSPDIVFSDIRMPEMTGCELAMQIRRRPGFEKLILAAISGFEDDEIRRATRAAGFNYQFVKPIRPAELEKFVDEVAQRRGSFSQDDR